MPYFRKYEGCMNISLTVFTDGVLRAPLFVLFIVLFIVLPVGRAVVRAVVQNQIQ